MSIHTKLILSIVYDDCEFNDKEEAKIKKLYSKYAEKSRLDIIRVNVTGQEILDTIQEIMKKV